MSNTTARFVSATCACGASFQREVKRGRPQVWCPACIEVPFYDRVKAAAPTVITETGEVVTIEAKPVNENDALGHVREQVEIEVAAAYAAHKVRFASLVAAGLTPEHAAAESGPIADAEVLAVYAKYRG